MSLVSGQGLTHGFNKSGHVSNGVKITDPNRVAGRASASSSRQPEGLLLSESLCSEKNATSGSLGGAVAVVGKVEGEGVSGFRGYQTIE